jgi:type III restriction enzyme
MELKNYQKRAIAEVKSFLDLLSAEQARANRHASLDAWGEAKGYLPTRGVYQERENGLRADVPTFCIKVPTGGGKTLLATQFLGLVYQTTLKSRNGAGLVLWIVPSDQIYKDTLRALRDRRHFYRESLEFAVARRVEVWEKHEIIRITPSHLQSNFNVLILKLAGTNRVDREQLKFFRDSGGNIVQHFPPEDQPEKHKVLKGLIPNLDMLADDEERGEYQGDTVARQGRQRGFAAFAVRTRSGRSQSIREVGCTLPRQASGGVVVVPQPGGSRLLLDPRISTQ